MKTIIDVFEFLNRIEYINNFKSEEDNFPIIRIIIVGTFIHHDAPKLVDILNIFDQLSFNHSSPNQFDYLCSTENNGPNLNINILGEDIFREDLRNTHVDVF